MKRRVAIQWTSTARRALEKLPLKIRRGLIHKADELAECEDPEGAHKPLLGPLTGYYSIKYSRYRAIYTVEHETLTSGEILEHVRIRFVAAGIRKEGDKKDVYSLALRLLRLGLLGGGEEEEKTDKPSPPREP